MNNNPAWKMLRENFKADGKGRHKTTDAMQVAKHFASEVERLTSGPGGIMEMKQTIADKEKRIEELEEAIRDLLQYVPRSDLYNVSPRTFAVIKGI